MKLTERVLMSASKIMQRSRTKLYNKEKREYYNGNEIFLKIFVIFMSRLHFINENVTNNGLLKLHKIFQLNRKCNIRVPYDAKLNKIHFYDVLYIISTNLYAISITDICTFIVRISGVQYWQIAASRKTLISLIPFFGNLHPAGFYEAFAVPPSVTARLLSFYLHVTPRKTQSSGDERLPAKEIQQEQFSASPYIAMLPLRASENFPVFITALSSRPGL